MRLLSVRLVTLCAVLAGCAAPSTSPSAEAVLAKPASGFIVVAGGKVAYEVHGPGTGTPLLVLHGGPGIPHEYRANLAQLGDDRPVVFYDQLGCGKSDRPDDASLGTRERFSRELASVRAAILAGPALSIPRWIGDSRRLIAALPPETARPSSRASAPARPPPTPTTPPRRPSTSATSAAATGRRPSWSRPARGRASRSTRA